MSDGDEIDLIQGLKTGCPEAQRRLWDSHYEAVFGFVAIAILKGRAFHDAEDITQDAFLRAFRSIGTFRGDCRLRTWLITLARHAAVDHRRREASRSPPNGAVNDPEVLEGVADPHDSPRTGPAAGLLAEERRYHLVDLLAKLPEAQREVVVHRNLNGLSVAETAVLMGKSEGAVKMLHARTLRGLAERGGAPGSYFADLLTRKGAAGHDGE
ncbi:MAG: sigma-70 family RNA polymerase sigma factor [Planctomycetaceae bacterium]|nr:sigma-70 family RNA polymerase sigma factor [Planctomycetota bacterium]NUN51420.1 sigma-70 family RNA polymerase sigma factor [Planctomycetaceae bacterium]